MKARLQRFAAKVHAARVRLVRVSSPAIAQLDFADACLAAGLCLLGVGAWWIYPPASLLLLGVILLGMGIRGMK